MTTPATSEQVVQQQEGEWIDWAGGECPVPADTLVRVWLANETEQEALQFPPRSAAFWSRAWPRKRVGNRIRAYRIEPRA